MLSTIIGVFLWVCVACVFVSVVVFLGTMVYLVLKWLSEL